MDAETVGLWALIFALLVAVCGVANEISYRLHRWWERRTLDKSAIWDIKKRRGQIR